MKEEWSILGTSEDGRFFVMLDGPFSNRIEAMMVLFPAMVRAVDYCGLKGICLCRTRWDDEGGRTVDYFEKYGEIDRVLNKIELGKVNGWHRRRAGSPASSAPRSSPSTRTCGASSTSAYAGTRGNGATSTATKPT